MQLLAFLALVIVYIVGSIAVLIWLSKRTP